MTREIKFRAKRLDNGEWVYGYLCENVNGEICIQDIVGKVVDGFAVPSRLHPVNPDTIGQYTGVKDKNGREIYEGDVVRFLDADNKVKNKEVRFGGGGFTPVVEICWLANIEGMFAEVIGNIHDNPELLEE